MRLRAVLAFAVVPLVTLLLAPTPAAARPLDPSWPFTSQLDLEPMPENGFLAVWQRDVGEPQAFGPDTCRHQQAVGAHLDPYGRPDEEGVQPLTFEGEPENPSAVKIALSPLRSAWYSVAAYTTSAGLKVGDFSGFSVTSPALLSSCTVHHFDVIDNGSFWVVWGETCDGYRIRAQRFSSFYGPQGPAMTLVEEDLAGPAQSFAVAAGLYLAWVEDVSDDPTDGRRVVMARFGADGERVTDVVPVGDPILEPGAPGDSLDLSSITSLDAETRRIAVTWRGDDDALHLRTVSPDLEPRESILLAEEGHSPVLPDFHGNVVAAWKPTGGGAGDDCRLRVFDSALDPLGAAIGLGTTCGAPVAIAFSEETRAPLTAWRRSDLPSSTCDRTELRATQPPGVVPSPPYDSAFESPTFPGYVFHVVIGGDEDEPRFGTPEPDCLPETVCVSGALPGRSEVLLRIVGPKPNGFLWPTIVRFTTSQVEVWIWKTDRPQQTRYYRLEGTSRDSGELDGLFDREGFDP